MRNLHYPMLSMRLSETTRDSVKKLKKEEDQTYNLLMVDLLHLYKRFGHKLKPNNKKSNKKVV